MRSICIAVALFILSSFVRVSAQGMKMDAPRVHLDKLDTSKSNLRRTAEEYKAGIA